LTDNTPAGSPANGPDANGPGGHAGGPGDSAEQPDGLTRPARSATAASTDGTPVTRPPDDATPDTVATERALTNRRVARMRAAVRERDARIRMLEQRLTALEESTSMALGRAVAAAARRPGRGVRRLPGQLYRLWRQRREPTATGGQPPGGKGAGDQAGTAPADGALIGFGTDEDRLLARTPGLTGNRIAIAGVFGPALGSALEGCAHLISLLPHDAPLALERSDPDLVVVDATAAAGGPWAYLGEPGVVDRERSMLATLEAARSRGYPVVLWTGDAPVPPGLARLRWDAVETGGPGVPLHRFNPVGWTGADPTPLFVDPGVDRLPAGVRRSVRAMVEEVGADRVDAAAPGLPAALRARLWTVAATPQQALEQLACGARVLCPPPVARTLGAAERFVHTTADAFHEAAGGSGADPVRPGAVRGDLRAVLRTLFETHATPVRLAGLVERLGIDAIPLRGRGVAVVATAPDVPRARRLVAELLEQTHPPAELLLPGGAGSHDAFAVAAAELAAHGIVVRPARGVTPAEAAATARSPWLAPWPDSPVHPGHLADLLCAAECTDADIIGSATGEPAPTAATATTAATIAVRPGSSDADPAGYAFAGDPEPALLRTTLLRTPGGLAHRGTRRLTMTSL
jgi:hypothetical protein